MIDLEAGVRSAGGDRRRRLERTARYSIVIALAGTGGCSLLIDLSGASNQFGVTEGGVDENGSSDAPTRIDDGGRGNGDTGGPSCDANVNNDPKNCGLCGHDCLGAQCASSRCQPVTLATGLSAPSDMAIDATGLYVVAGRVIHVDPRDGGVRPLSNTAGKPSGIALDDTAVYFVDNATSSTGVYRTNKRDGGASSLVALGDYVNVLGIAVDATYVYWVEGASHRIGRADKTDGGNSGQFGFDVSTDYMNGGPWGIVVDSSHVFWTDLHAIDAGGQLEAVPVQGGTSSVLVPSRSNPSWLILDNDALYWFEAPGSIQRAPKSTGVAATVTSDPGIGDGTSSRLALDATSVYWTDYTTGQVMIAPKNPSAPAPPTELANGQGQPVGIAVDDAYVYWANSATGTIMRVAK